MILIVNIVHSERDYQTGGVVMFARLEELCPERREMQVRTTGQKSHILLLYALL